MINFHVGQKVVCVDDRSDIGKIWWDGEAPRKGAVYTVARIFPDPLNGTIILHLQELRRAEYSVAEWNYPDLGYRASRFRPVRITSINVFTAMLAPTPRIKEAV